MLYNHLLYINIFGGRYKFFRTLKMRRNLYYEIQVITSGFMLKMKQNFNENLMNSKCSLSQIQNALAHKFSREPKL